MDTQAIIAKSKGFGRTDIPTGSSSNPEAEKLVSAILNASPGKYFKTKDLGALLKEAGIVIEKPGNLMFSMKMRDLCSSPAKGVYRNFDGKSNKKAATAPQ